MAKVQLNLNPLVSVLTSVFSEMAQELNEQFQETIRSPIFEWDTTTKRRNGQTVASPRDIVDRGTFLNSQEYSLPQRNFALYRWNAKYAVYIFYGYTTRKGNTQKPRDWVKPTLDRYKLLNSYGRKVKARLSR